MGLFSSITVAPAIPILRLGLVKDADVIDNIIAERFHELRVVHIRRQVGPRPLGPVIPIAIPIIAARPTANELAPAARTKKVAHTPAQALYAIAAIINRESSGTHVICSRNIVVIVCPAVLELRELSGIRRVAGMPSLIKIICNGPITTRRSYLGNISLFNNISITVADIFSIHIPAVIITNHFECRVSAGIVVVDGMQERTQVIAVVELEIAHRMIAIAPAKALIVVLSTLPCTEIQHLLGTAARGQRLSRIERDAIALGFIHLSDFRTVGAIFVDIHFRTIIRRAVHIANSVGASNHRERKAETGNNRSTSECPDHNMMTTHASSDQITSSRSRTGLTFKHSGAYLNDNSGTPHVAGSTAIANSGRRLRLHCLLESRSEPRVTRSKPSVRGNPTSRGSGVIALVDVDNQGVELLFRHGANHRVRELYLVASTGLLICKQLHHAGREQVATHGKQTARGILGGGHLDHAVHAPDGALLVAGGAGKVRCVLSTKIEQNGHRELSSVRTSGAHAF